MKCQSHSNLRKIDIQAENTTEVTALLIINNCI